MKNLDSKWCKFFEAYGIRFEYLENRTPCFLLPDFGDLIKGNGFYADTMLVLGKEKYETLSQYVYATGNHVLLLEGEPDFCVYSVLYRGEKNLVVDALEPDDDIPDWINLETGLEEVQQYKGIINNRNKYGQRMFVEPGIENNEGYFSPDDWDIEYKKAIETSRL